MKLNVKRLKVTNLHVIDIAVIAVYLVLCLVIGLNKIGRIKTIKEYTLGTGYISTAVLVATIFATKIGAAATLGTVEKLHSMGLIFALAVMFRPLFWIITALIFAKNINYFKKKGCISVSDIMGILYGKTGKWVTNILSILLSIGIIAIQISAIGYLFNYFLGMPHVLGVLLGFGVLVVYSLFGGIKAVAFTDSFQGLILLVAVPMACVIAFHEVGSYDGMLASLPTSHLEIDFSKDNILLLMGLIFYALMPVTEGTFIQRFLMANDSKQLIKAFQYTFFIYVPFFAVLCLIGFVMKAKAPDIDPNTAFFYLISNYLPIGVTGLLITGILAAIMSTADSWLNTTGVLCAHDVIKGIFPRITDRQELLAARISVLLISVLSTFLALTGTSIMSLEWLASNFWGPVILIPLSAGFLGFRTDAKSFIMSCITAIMGSSLGAHLTGGFDTVSILFGVMGSAIGLFGMNWWQKSYNSSPANEEWVPKEAE